MPGLVWGPLDESDLPGLVRLASSCLRADGGLPLLQEEQTLRGRVLSGPSTGARDELGDLVAAAGLAHDPDGGSTMLGMVHPSFRRLGLGADLIHWAREHTAGRPLRVAVESLNASAEDLLSANGLVQVFAETVMRHDLRDIPFVRRPAGIRTVAFGDHTAHAFYAAYVRSFSDRPGFPDPTESEWLTWLREDHDFRPDLSRVALDEADDPVGFVTVSRSWIDQVGVVPESRGKGLGAHLTARTLSAIAGSGADEAWLCVNVDNPTARELYEKLGFTVYGTRARYTEHQHAAVVRVEHP
ncbi:GNAT family N-acetyltransferase [Phycicoccus sp. SLBN-51]|uniref:GNAT family N-acetyltransferase n=1 Tax=Phycicoccus sp. SLBN-51 TaxID=2768447 RepID=UPI00114F5F6B|nr:GNAT family N-acetyltransferase [Phycicoccus sp. SLBN-51]TQJ50072.1 mycothiol synthase [Phycicoccus sp. SLBN-51]